MGKVHVTGYENSVRSSVDSFVANLPEMLGAMAADPRCLVAIAEFEDERYVQFWVGADGDVISEVISNLNIGDAVALSDEDEQALRDLGWSEPSPGPNPNWRFESVGISELLVLVSMTRDAVYTVLRERPGNTVSLRSWEMPETSDQHRDDLRERSRVAYQERFGEIEKQIEAMSFDD